MNDSFGATFFLTGLTGFIGFSFAVARGDSCRSFNGASPHAESKTIFKNPVNPVQKCQPC
jgi:hypothetical protein